MDLSHASDSVSSFNSTAEEPQQHSRVATKQAAIQLIDIQRIPSFIDRNMNRRLGYLIDNMRRDDETILAHERWPILANFRRDRSIAYFSATVRARNVLSRAALGYESLSDYFRRRLGAVLRINANVASCPTFGPMFAVNPTDSHSQAYLVRQYRTSDFRGWPPSNCQKMWKLIVPINLEDGSGSIAIYRHRDKIQSIRCLVGSEVQHFYPRTGELLIFNAKLPHEYVPGTSRALYLECFLGQLPGSNNFIMWS